MGLSKNGECPANVFCIGEHDEAIYLKWVVSEVTKAIFGSPQIVCLVIYPNSHLVFITRFPDPKLRISRPTSCLILGNPGLSDTNAHASWAWFFNSIEISRFPYSKVSWKHPNFYILRFFPWFFSPFRDVHLPGWKAQCGGCAAPLGFSCQRSWILFRAWAPVRPQRTFDRKFGTSKGHSQSMPKCCEWFFVVNVVNVNVKLSMLSHDWTKKKSSLRWCGKGRNKSSGQLDLTTLLCAYGWSFTHCKDSEI